MLKIDGTTIHLTRGDEASIQVKLKNDTQFTVGQVVSLIVVPKNGYTKGTVMRKDVTVSQASDTLLIPLLSTDTKIGEEIDKKVTYWYNIVVDDEQTIIGSDEEGEKLLILYPEGGE